MPVPELGAGIWVTKADMTHKDLAANGSGLLKSSKGWGNVLSLLHNQAEGKEVHRVDWLHFYKMDFIFIVVLTGGRIISTSVFQTSGFETKSFNPQATFQSHR